MVKSFLAAALQCTSTPDPDSNFAQIEELIDLAARRGAELVGLPENFAFLGAENKRLELAPTLAERCSPLSGDHGASLPSGDPWRWFPGSSR